MVGVALVGLVLFLLWRRPKRREAAFREHATHHASIAPELDATRPHRELDDTSRRELDGTSKNELDNTSKPPPAEMEQPYVVNELDGKPIHDGNASSAH